MREVDRNGNADEQDAVEFDSVAHPPAEFEVARGKRCDERCREPDHTREHHEIEAAAREEKRSKCTPRKQRKDRQARTKEQQRGRAASLRDGGDQRRKREGDGTRRRDREE